MSNLRLTIPLKTNIQRVEGCNLDAEAGVVRCQFSVATRPRFIGQYNTSKGDTQLTATEEKAMYRVSLRRFVSDDSLVVKLSKNDVLAKRVHGKPGVTRYLVVLTVFEGQNSPPVALQELDYSATFTHAKSSGTEEGDDNASNAGHTETSTTPGDLKFDEWAKFKRSSLPPGHASSSQRRWFRIHAAKCGEYKMPRDLDNPISKTDGVRLHLIQVSVEYSTLSVRSAVDLCSKASACDPTTGIALNLFEQLAGEVPYMPVAEKLVNLTCCPAVLAATQPTFRIQLNRNNELLLLETWQSSVHLQTDHRSLADFVVDHCRSALRSLQSCDGIALLETKLRGVNIQVRTSAGHETRRVVNFKKGTVSDVPSDHKHYAWPSAGGLFLSPNLPLVNVGLLDKPLYLPMEVCKISEDQPLHGPRDIRLNCSVNSMNRQIALRDLSNAPEHGSLVFHQIPKKWDKEL